MSFADQHPATPAPPAPRRAWLPWTIAGLALAALAVGTVVFLFGAQLRGGLSEEVAQRECRTALEKEASRRATELDPGGESGFVVTVKNVDMAETYKAGDGWKVNGTVAYTITGGVLPQVEQSVSLTCEATGTDDAVTAAVTNRS